MTILLCKTCSTCHIEQDINQFCKCVTSKDGRNKRCRGCVHDYYVANKNDIIARVTIYYFDHIEEKSAYNAAYYLLHRDHILQQVHTYRLAHLEEERIRSATYREIHAEELRVQNAAYRLEHLEEIRDRSARYYAIHTDEILAKNALYRLAHLEEECKRAMVYRDTHKEILRQKKSAYYKEHPEIRLDSQRRRRARKANAPQIDLSAGQWQEVLAAAKGRCAYCPDDCLDCRYKRHELTQEHVTSFYDNGSHTLPNVLAVCQPHNSQKGASSKPLRPVQMHLLTEAAPKPYKPRTKKELSS